MGGKGQTLALRISGGIVAIVLLLGVIAPFIGYDPVADVDYEAQLLGPSWAHVFGTDGQGRDVAIRLVKGTEAFFLPGLLAAAIAVIGGALAGAVAGYLQGIGRSVVLGGLQLLDTLPRLVFIILLCTIMNPSITLIAGVAGLLFVPAIATVIRRKVEALGSEDYILAHVAHGFSPARILLYHILWLQCRPLLIRQATFVFGYVLFVETALSYLGDYGVQEPSPSWGNMVAQTRDLAGQAPWPWLFPALAIVVTIAAFLSFGNLLARRDEEAIR
ncbi:MAG: ABC transporter permease [Myxococcales bacterium]|nr:ABC transporter permease [Myxococcales bacterium]MCB9549110.1 ABC transporter permease [Myxococcales bacterium]